MAPNRKLNGYILFVNEWQKRTGERNFEAAIKKASDEWNSLSEENKIWYKEEAKARNAGAKGRPLPRTPQPSPSSSASLLSNTEKDSLERVSLKERIQDPEMRSQLVDAFCSKSIEELLSTDIYVMSFNVAVKTKNNIYIPIEVGIVKFNLAKGIRGFHHDFIDGGRIPVGHGYEVKEHMEKIHRLPLFDISEYPVVEEVATHNPTDHVASVSRSIAAIENFVQTERVSIQDGTPDLEAPSYKPVFTLPDLDGLGLEQTDGCLKRMGLEVGDLKFYENYFVLDLTYLLFALIKRSGAATRPLASCADLLNWEVHNYMRGTDCMFHETMDIPHCALARSYRFSYCMLDTLIPLFNVEVTSNHVPEADPEPIEHTFAPLPPALQRIEDRATRISKAKGTYWSDL